MLDFSYLNIYLNSTENLKIIQTDCPVSNVQLPSVYKNFTSNYFIFGGLKVKINKHINFNDILLQATLVYTVVILFIYIG